MAGYGTNEAAQAYWEAAGYVVPDGTNDAQKTAARQRGSLAIDRYERFFSGTRTGGFAQERAWPRTGASTYYGEAIPSDMVPVAIENASYEAAWLELGTPGILSPVVTGSSTVKREKVGQLEVEYSTSSSTSMEDVIAMATPVVTAIEGLLWPLMTPRTPSIFVV